MKRTLTPERREQLRNQRRAIKPFKSINQLTREKQRRSR